MKNNRLYWLGFSLFPGIGPGRFATLLSYFKTAENAWNASIIELKYSKISEKLAEEFIVFRQKISLERYEDLLQQKNVSYITKEESAYPQQLGLIKNSPFVIFTKGNTDMLSDLHEHVSIGVVGTRKITEYGRQVTQHITGDLVDTGCVIVSGLAMGVDAVAHQATLDRKGKTIAVLGCGVDCCSPRENELLYQSIVANGGVIVSEYGLGIAPNKGSFPARNRIIAGLSQGVLVTEGAADSGALITAKDAKAYVRKVFAVPGPVTSSLSQGTYQLIKNGATIISSAREILEELGVTSNRKKQKAIRGDTPEEQQIIDALAQEDASFDELVKRTRIASAKLGGIVSIMEMKGVIKRSDAGFFVLPN
jgi:DNA processing protein